MAHELFPWTPEQDVPSENIPPASAEENIPWKIYLKKYLPYSFFGFLLMLLYMTRPHSSAPPKKEIPNADIETVMPLLPIRKNAPLRPERLRLVPFSEADFTKSQRLQLVQPHDLAQLNGQLKAKKDLPPHRPLFWKDLTFVEAPSPPRHVRILSPSRERRDP